MWKFISFIAAFKMHILVLKNNLKIFDFLCWPWCEYYGAIDAQKTLKAVMIKSNSRFSSALVNARISVNNVEYVIVSYLCTKKR